MKVYNVWYRNDAYHNQVVELDNILAVAQEDTAVEGRGTVGNLLEVEDMVIQGILRVALLGR